MCLDMNLVGTFEGAVRNFERVVGILGKVLDIFGKVVVVGIFVETERNFVVGDNSWRETVPETVQIHNFVVIPGETVKVVVRTALDFGTDSHKVTEEGDRYYYFEDTTT